MLSRVAERVYWLGRYMERMENAARLINVNSTLLMDLPRGAQVGWYPLVDIMGCNEEFTERGLKEDEAAIVKFIMADPANTTSIFTSIKMARENARTAREIIPTESWELINDLFIKVKENASKSVARSNRQRFLQDVIRTAQQLTGMLAGTMSHTSAYDFIRLGRNLERADMTTRIIDVGAVNLITNLKSGKTNADTMEPFINILWMSVLQSLSAYQMYRQHVRDRVNAKDVVEFILQDEYFPRSVTNSLMALVDCLNALPDADDALRAVGITQRHVNTIEIANLLETNGLHEVIDTIQLNIASINDEIAKKWFLSSASNEAA